MRITIYLSFVCLFKQMKQNVYHKYAMVNLYEYNVKMIQWYNWQFKIVALLHYEIKHEFDSQMNTSAQIMHKSRNIISERTDNNLQEKERYNLIEQTKLLAYVKLKATKLALKGLQQRVKLHNIK
ncbi:hypothetical protein V1478_018907 [Vespula squamosa]|uniref:Uncharacterized protein n=1 Tax=Vespula squamosa TaxID=30214 RepID=A0ABD1ZU53_VESSQ